MPDVTPANAQHSLELDLDRAREIAERGGLIWTGSRRKWPTPCEAPQLPDHSDVAAVDKFVVRAYRRMWDARG